MRTWIGRQCRETPRVGPCFLKTVVYSYILLGDQPASLDGALVQITGDLRVGPAAAPQNTGSIVVRRIKRYPDAPPR